MKLILFTNSYPYGIGEMWKHNEIMLIGNNFQSIDVFPLRNGGNDKAKTIDLQNVKLHPPLFDNEIIRLAFLDILLLLTSRRAVIIFKELFISLPTFNKKNLIKVFNSAKIADRILSHNKLVELFEKDNPQTILYFYWGLGCAEILPFLDLTKFRKIVVRMHRYDLYEYENYIPFRKQLTNCKVTILPSSDDGLMHLKGLYPNHIAEIKTQRCGVMKARDKSICSLTNLLKIVSCSLLVPVKRINLMLEAASLLNLQFEWHHIGYGELENELKEIVS